MKLSVTILTSGIFGGSLSVASPLSMDPLIGLSADFATNPDLRQTGQHAETHGAVLLNLPINYDSDDLHFALLPAARYSNTKGYSSLASNFYRVDANANETSELGSITFSGGIGRDSSLYHSGDANQGVGVQRDTASAGLTLQRSMTERTQAQLALNWVRTKYGDSAAATGLVSYRYISAGPTFGYALDERTTVNLIGSAGRYNSLDQTTLSRDYDLELGFNRDLNELWNLSASYGYSRSMNSIDVYFGPFFLGTADSTQRGSVYNAALKRKGETLTFTGTVSRELRPTGFAFLSRQQSVDAQVNYQYSERWQFTGDVNWHKSVDPLFGGGEASRRNLYGQLAAIWNWREDWMITLRATRVDQRFNSATNFYAVSNGVSLEFSHQFQRTDLN